MLDFFLHLDKHLAELITTYGDWIYGILFATIFAETGLVVMPILPGDSLLFAAGLFSHPERGNLSAPLLIGLLSLAAICGDNVNYWVGKLFGEKLFRHENSKLFKRSHLDKTHAFFERHGPKTIILARFVPIVRTFTPFVAGMGAMTYPRFLGFSVFAAFFWVGICVGAGHFFGGIEIVRRNFAVAALAIVAISVLPMVVEVVRHRKHSAGGRADYAGETPTIHTTETVVPPEP